MWGRVRERESGTVIKFWLPLSFVIIQLEWKVGIYLVDTYVGIIYTWVYIRCILKKMKMSNSHLCVGREIYNCITYRYTYTGMVISYRVDVLFSLTQHVWWCTFINWCIFTFLQCTCDSHWFSSCKLYTTNESYWFTYTQPKLPQLHWWFWTKFINFQKTNYLELCSFSSTLLIQKKICLSLYWLEHRSKLEIGILSINL